MSLQNVTQRTTEIARQVAYRVLGRSVARSVSHSVQDALSYASYKASPRARASASRLRDLQGMYTGRRAFIIGNGPSLRRMDLAPLRGEITFGLNRINLIFSKLGFGTTFLVAVNRLVVQQSGGEILTAPVSERFISWSAREYLPSASHPILLRSLTSPQFSKDAAVGVWEGATVTYVAMQLAYHLGIRDVVLIGVDHTFVTTGAPHTVVTSNEPDRNHFDPSYFGPGYRWQLPDLETSEVAYRMARSAFEAVGGRVRDATVDGQLDVFPKVDFAALFSESGEGTA